ncbi:MAG TPA: hypothetical protein VGP08_18830 [Pyrinomonadaceae bacterium]|jgi:hypothetical protein|nr:hypothetical protein [Pyrinomonadaceae bacterium]
MDSNDRQNYITKLDEELLVGGVMLSEWSTFLIRDADEAFCNRADLATILVSQAAIESHLRYEYVDNPATVKLGFYALIEQSPLSSSLKADMHKLRKYRNKWVHVNDPSEDTDLLERPEYYEKELEEMALLAIRVLREVIYQEQWL